MKPQEIVASTLAELGTTFRLLTKRFSPKIEGIGSGRSVDYSSRTSLRAGLKGGFFTPSRAQN
jgi:hypothetical protein